jgi:hypothetical protein
MSNSNPEQPSGAGELAAVLNQSELRLSREVRVNRLRTDRLVVKYQPGRRHPVVSPRQWELLQEFSRGRTVTGVLCAAIEVVCSKVASCMAIGGRDFLDFLTQDFTVAMRWEEMKFRRVDQTRQKRGRR